MSDDRAEARTDLGASATLAANLERVERLLATVAVALAIAGLVAMLALGVEPPGRLLALAVDPRLLVPTLLLVGTAVVLRAGAIVLPRTRTDEPALPEPPERHHPRARDSSNEVEAAIDAVASGRTGDTGAGLPADVLVALEDLAVEAVSRAENVDPQRARRRVRDGTWTERRRALQLLADDPPPRRIRTAVIDWFRGDRDRRDLVATVEAIEQRFEEGEP